MLDTRHSFCEWIYLELVLTLRSNQVVGGLWTSWFERLERQIEPGASGEEQEQGHGHVEQEGMAEFFEAVVDEYNAGHTYDLLNRIVSSWQVPANTDMDVLTQSLRQDCLTRGSVDYAALRRLILDAGIQPRLNCIHCKRFGRGGSHHGPGGGLLCSGCEKAWVQTGHTEPPTVQGATAGTRDAGVIEQLMTVVRQAEQAIARPWAWCGARSAVGKHAVRHFLLGS